MRVSSKEWANVRRIDSGPEANTNTEMENEMYGMVQHEAWRQRPAEIRQELAMIRLEKATRENGETTLGLLRDLRWELARFAGLVGKRLRSSE
jgi:hypothetical protein